MKKKIFLILIILVIIFGGVFFLLKDKIFNFGTKAREIKDVECLALNKKCSFEDLTNGILVNYPVSNNETKEFYVMNDTPSDITLISKDNIVSQTDWSSSFINKTGPILAYEKLKEQTTSWTNVKLLNNFEYEDTGYINYRSICLSDDKYTILDSINNETLKAEYKKKIDEYECDKLTGAGYPMLYIIDGKLFITSYYENPYVLENVRARLPYIEEISQYLLKDRNTWLNNMDSFWTMTSSTDINTDYFTSALAFINTDNNISFTPIAIKKSGANIGLNAVITVDKK